MTVSTEPILAWQFGNPASLGNEVTYNATTNNTNLTTSILSRGSGIVPNPLLQGFSSKAWDNVGTKATATATDEYFQFTIQTKINYKVSLSTIDATLRRSGSTSPCTYIWEYSLNGSTFTEIGSDIGFTTTGNADVQTQVNLSGIADLQNIESATTITLRLYAWGGTDAGSTFAFGRYSAGVTTNCLAIGGIVQALSGIIAPTATAATSLKSTCFDANWNGVFGATGYKLEVNAVSSGSISATDLFISEYIEGSSNNKAIEIYNGTGAPVDLSKYSLKKQTSGVGAYTVDYPLSGMLANGAVYVLANSLANASIIAIANISTTSVITAFNGNDAIGLFKNGVQIDEVGVFNQVTTWGQNVTLIRKNNISSPKTIYSAADWAVQTTDYISDLGLHSMNNGAIVTPVTGSPFTISSGNTTTYTVTGLTQNSNYVYVVRAVDGIIETPSSNTIAVKTIFTPVLTINPTNLSNFNYVTGSGPSAEKSFIVGGTNFNSDIIVTAPEHYEISITSGVTFAPTSSIVLIKNSSGVVTPTNIYVRLKAGLVMANYNTENVILTSCGLMTRHVICNGFVDLKRWSGTTNSDWTEATNWTGNVVPIGDESIGFDEFYLRDCILNVDCSVTNISNSTTAKILTNGHKLIVKGDLNFTNGATIDASSLSSTIEFAGVDVQSIPMNTFLNNKVYNLIVNNLANVKLSGSLNLLNNLTASSGLLDAFTNSPTFVYDGTLSQTIGNQFVSDRITNLIINNAVNVMVNTDITVNNVLTINENSQLIIPTEKQLTVNGFIDNQAGVSGIVIKASSTGEVPNGSLIFHNGAGSNVQATVEMYTKAFCRDGKFKWQFFGIPLRTMTASPTFDGSYVRQMHEDDLPKHWYQLNNTADAASYISLNSFTGYEITQVSSKTIYFKGELENKDYNSGQLSYSSAASYSGQHLISNPYTAAIDIKKLVFGAQTKRSIYLYNCGSNQDWEAGLSTGGGSGNAPGQYIVVPQNVAGSGMTRHIPSMQAFLIIDSITTPGDHSLTIPYSGVVIKNTDLQQVPSNKETDVSVKVFTTIDVKGSRFSDRLWIFSEPICTRGFDNGWDGEKIFGSTLTPQLFAIEDDGNYQVNSVNDINNTELGFQAGEDSKYTLTFAQNNLEYRYSSLYLMDLKENKTIDITVSGTEYSFETGQTGSPVKRFRIVTDPLVSTGTSTAIKKSLKVFSSGKTILVCNENNTHGELLLYSISGQFIQKLPFSSNCITTMPLNLPVGFYLTKAKTEKEEVATCLILR